MVDADYDLAERSKVYKTTKTVELIEDQSFYRVISADAKAAHGGNTHAAVIDELHTQPDRELCDVLQTSMGSRRNPLFLSITTADYDRPSVCNEKLRYARRVRDDELDDPTFLPVIYETLVEEDWTDPAVWRKANPNFEVSLYGEFLEREFAKAQEVPAFENTFKRLYLNMTTQQEHRWLPVEVWDEAPDLLPEHLRGPCWCGLDLASTTDVTAAVVVFDCGDGTVAVLPRFWVPGDMAHKRERRDKVPYVDWHKRGLLTLTEGNVIDYDVVRADLRELQKQYGFREVIIDRWNATQMALDLKRDGMEPILCAQTYSSLNEPSKRFEKLVLGRQLRHGGNAVLRWMLGNVAVETDSLGNIRPDRKKSTEKIDGICALIMGLIKLDAGAPAPSIATRIM